MPSSMEINRDWKTREGPFSEGRAIDGEEAAGCSDSGGEAAVPRGDRLTVTNAWGDKTILAVASDGSVAGYVPAQSSERLELVATQSQEEGQSLEVVVRTGRRSGYDGAIDGLVLGTDEDILAPDDEGQVLVHGNGELLRTGSLVVGANLDASTATTTMVSCSPSCAFDLFVPGSSGDELGLFLVVSGQQSGYTEAETIDVP